LPTDAPAQDTGIEAQLAEWQQGDFSINCGGFLFGDSSLEDGNAIDPVIDDNIEGFAVITQTCDIVRETNSVPYVTVCALTKIDPSRLVDLEKGQAPRFGLLSGIDEGVVADFSRTMTISKELLIAWSKRRGCPTVKDQVAFARSLETYFGRFAFPDDFNLSISSLRKAILSKYSKTQSELGKAIRSIRELRVFPHNNWNDQHSVPITFIFVLDDEDHRELKERAAILKEVKPKIDAIKWSAPFSLHDDGIQVTTLSDMTAADYLNSYALDVNSISLATRYMKAIDDQP